MIDIKSGNIIETFHQIHHAISYVLEHNKDTIEDTVESKKSIDYKIRSVCNNKKDSVYGYIWKYDADPNDNMENEEWKNIRDIIPEAEDYLISNKGRMKNNKGIIVKGRTETNGYVTVYIGKDISRKTIHKLVAKLFIPNPENKPIVNHKNGIKHVNEINNLEWSSYSENTQHAFDTNLNAHGIKVKVTNTITNKTTIYPTKVNACKDIKVEIKTFNRYLKDNKPYKNMLFEIV